MRLRLMYFYLIKQSHQQHCKFLTFLFISTRRLKAMDQWNTEIFIESKSWLFRIPSGMAVNIIFWSREAKFSGFPNGKNHTYNISHYFIYKNQYSLPFIGSAKKGSEFQVSVNFNGRDSFFWWWDVGFFRSWNPEELLLLCSKLFYCLWLPFNAILQDR